MEIKKATEKDLNDILKIYDSARRYMREHGNPTQWGDSRPSAETIAEDIRKGVSYIITEDNIIHGVFAFITGEEPTYRIIENGAWHYDRPYGTIHRLASDGRTKGIASCCFAFCDSLIDYIRIDTHKDNKTMQAALRRAGFEECGIIYVSNGPRIAYDRLRKQVQPCTD